ncbi:MAG: ABC transporter substrate-binding protein [Pseudomonadales bacterium]
MMNRAVCWLLGLSGLLLVQQLNAAQPVEQVADLATEQTAAVANFHLQLVAMMKLPDHAARAALIEPVVVDLFDLRRIASVSLGRSWQTLTAPERAEFVQRLTELVVATYADRFDNYAGQRFEHVQTETVRDGTVVRTVLHTSKATVQLDYFLRDGRVFNVAADGVSDLSLRRADYSSIIKTEGYPALMDHIQRKIQEARGQ